MPLTPGTRLGPYEVTNSLGAGGMGEVYRARDTRLGRDVAIKVLLEGAAADPDLRRRFEQEARAVAALSHPNIVALHDVGTHDGAPFLVSELLEGETLADAFFRAVADATDRELSWLDFSIVNGLSDDGRRALISEQGDSVGSVDAWGELYIRDRGGSHRRNWGRDMGGAFPRRTASSRRWDSTRRASCCIQSRPGLPRRSHSRTSSAPTLLACWPQAIKLWW